MVGTQPSDIYVRPHFDTNPFPALVVQFRNWNVNVPKLALAIFLSWCRLWDQTDLVRSFNTGRPIPEWFQTWVNGKSRQDSSGTGHPVPELDAPNWHGAHLGTLTFQFQNWTTSAGTGLVLICNIVTYIIHFAPCYFTLKCLFSHQTS